MYQIVYIRLDLLNVDALVQFVHNSYSSIQFMFYFIHSLCKRNNSHVVH